MKRIFALILIFVVCISSSYAANIDSQIKSQQKTQSDMKKKIQQYNNIAKQKSKQSKTLLSQLSRLKQNADESQKQMNNLQQENERLQKSVGELNKSIANVNATMSQIIEILKSRLVGLYKFAPEENSLSVLMNSHGTHEAINASYMLRRFVQNDAEMFHQLSEKEHELTQARAQLEADRSKITRQTDELKKKRAEYNTTIKKTDNLLKNVQSEKKKAEAAAKELESAQKAVGNKINALLKQKKAAQQKKAAAAKKNAQAAKNSNSSSKTAQNSSSTTQTQASVTTLAWPVSGKVVMQYGSREHPTFKTKIFNSGIDIQAASGTPVKAAGPGEVLYQGWLRGFGQVVILDHGGDLTTVYAHLASAAVKEGASVKTGTVIGRVGNSGTETEYGLHFEVRKNGTAQNPMNYLR